MSIITKLISHCAVFLQFNSIYVFSLGDCSVFLSLCLKCLSVSVPGSKLTGGS